MWRPRAKEANQAGALRWATRSGLPVGSQGCSDGDGNTLRRHLRPAAINLGIHPKKATWRSLRTSYGTWMIEAGANPKDVQAQMRLSRISTMMDIYAQFVPDSQRRGVAKMMDLVAERLEKTRQVGSVVAN